MMAGTPTLTRALAFAVLLTGCDSPGQPTLLTPAPRDVVAIVRAIDAGDVTSLRDLLERGATPTPPGSPLSPLHAAITHFRDGKLVCDYEALKLLLDHHADPNFVDRDSGFSALEDALYMGDIPCASLLKERGASVDRHGHSGQSILQFAVKGAVRTDSVEILRLVLSWGVDPNVLSSTESFTALHIAAWTNPGQAAEAEAVIAELLRAGTDPCIVNGRGQRALDIATNLRRAAPIQKLLAEATQACPAH